MNTPPKEGSSSPTKKSKAKFPDIERALINWARNEERKGEAISDDKLKKQALFFSSTFGNSDNHSHLTSDAWLDRFKQKNQLGTGKKSKSSSKDFSQVTIIDSSTTSYTNGRVDQSPASSASGLVSPPLSLEEDDLHQDGNKQGNDDFFDFGDRHVGHSMSLGEVVSPDLEASSAVLSPLSPDQQRPSSVSVTTATLEDSSPAYASAYSRQRSQTFAHFQSEESGNSRPNSSGRHTPLPVRSMTTSIAPQDLHVNPREMMKRSESVPNIRDASAIYMSSMKPPPLPKSERNSPISPGSPTPDEARRALQTLHSFFQSQPSDTLDMDDWTSIGNMMRKLKLPRPGDEMPAGMVPLDILDDPRPMKKRTILGIST
jgi:Tc5 transposase DNA-binding domain